MNTQQTSFGDFFHPEPMVQREQMLRDELAKVEKEITALSVNQRVKDLETQLEAAKGRLHGLQGQGTSEHPDSSDKTPTPQPSTKASIVEDHKWLLLEIPKVYQARNVREYKKFVMACEKEFDTRPKQFADDKEKIKYAVRYIGFHANRIWNDGVSLRTHDWDSFKQYLRGLIW